MHNTDLFKNKKKELVNGYAETKFVKSYVFFASEVQSQNKEDKLQNKENKNQQSHAQMLTWTRKNKENNKEN